MSTLRPFYLRALKTFFLFLKRFYLSISRQRRREKEGEKHQCVVLSRVPPAGDLACNPGMCPDWELNQRPFSPVLNPLSHTSQGELLKLFCLLITQSPCYKILASLCRFLPLILGCQFTFLQFGYSRRGKYSKTLVLQRLPS